VEGEPARRRIPYRYIQTERLIIIIPCLSSVLSPLPYRNHQHHQRRSQMRNQTTKDPRKKRARKQPLAVIPYVSGVSERIRKTYEKFDLRVVFKSGPTLRSLLTKVKDPLPKEKLASVVYQIPCQCGKVYIGETQRRLETRVKEHRDACNKGDTWKSAIAEHQWDQQHQGELRCWTEPPVRVSSSGRDRGEAPPPKESDLN
jgi:hypothetical protein